MQKFLLFTRIVLWLAVLNTGKLFSQTGSVLDNSFSGDGIVVTNISGTSEDKVYDVEVAPDKKIVVTGMTRKSGNADLLIIRYNPDGTLDNTFSGDGIVVTSLGSMLESGGALVIQPDGKIIVMVNIMEGSEYNSMLLRYNVNGTLDNSFSGDGKLTIDFSAWDDQMNDVALQADGKIVVAGSTDDGAFSSKIFVARFMSNGSYDASFNSTGYKMIDIVAGDIDYATDLEIQPDNKIVMSAFAGDITLSVVIIRLNTNGSFDGSLGNNGIARSDWGAPHLAIARELELQTDGKIVLSGDVDWAPNTYNISHAVVARYNSDGTFDKSFAGDGQMELDFHNPNNPPAPASQIESVESLDILPDGKIIAGGWTSDFISPWYFAVARINTNGTFDNSFGNKGFAYTDIGNDFEEDIETSLVTQADGNILHCGYTLNNGNYDVTVVRYLTGSSPADPCSAAPAGLYADNIKATRARLHWNAATGAAKYKVQYRRAGASAWTSSTAAANVKNLTGLTPSVTYQYRVSILCAGFPQSPWSSIKTFTTLSAGLSEKAGQQEVSLYPNPVQSRNAVTVKLAGASATSMHRIQILNITKQVVYTTSIKGNSASIATGNLKPGVYFVQVIAEPGNEQTIPYALKKLIIK